MSNNFDYAAYFKRYRAEHPEQTALWRYVTSLRYIAKFEAEHPELVPIGRERAEGRNVDR